MNLRIDVVNTFFLSGCVAFMLMSSAEIARSREYQCARGLAIRSIVVEYQVPGQKVPCEVFYYEPLQIPRVLWKARAQAGFCESKADQLLQELDRKGWSCVRVQGAAPTAAGEVPSRLAQPEVKADVPEPTGLRGQETKPANAVRSNSEPTDTPREPTGAETAAPSEEADRFERTRQTGALAVGPRHPRMARFPDVALSIAFARDLRKLQEGSHAKVEAGSPRFGDLDGDGKLDAALLITFASGRADHLQYLVVYVYREGTYHLAASRFIGGSYRDVRSGELEAIEAGRIFIRLQIEQTDDVGCCPPGDQAAFVLENGSLSRLGE
jgi:hypothetical protein